MRFLFPLLLSLSLAITIHRPISAQEVPPQTVQEIRALYQTKSARWQNVPRPVFLAFAAVEDRLFFTRSPASSTITQQIALWLLPPSGEKEQARALTSLISNALSPDDILNWYVNDVFLGQGCVGVTDAALAYFDRPLQDLELSQTAFLAALPKAPGRLHPVKFPDKAIARRNHALSEMQRAGLMSKGEAAETSQMPLIVQKPLGHCEAGE